MTPKLEFCLLGPVVVRGGGAALPVPRGRQRAVLAVLLLNAGRVVSVGEIAETLWGPAPLPSASATVRNYVKRLRRALGDGDQARIVTRSPGYVIRVDPGELDVARFEVLLDGARTAARGGSWEAAADQARAALALWRGEPLADVESDALALREVPRLAELRLQATELRIGAELRLGRHGVVIAELERLAAAHPLREHLHALLMLALYRDGRQAEALAAYQHARRLLVDELGAEPGAELRELHQQILTTGPAPAGPGFRQLPSEGIRPAGVRPAGSGPWTVVPQELPGPVPQFVGRAAELAGLTGMLERASAHRPRTLVISAIAGMAGVGKTALAMQWAHQVADRFPDGQLHDLLRAYAAEQAADHDSEQDRRAALTRLFDHYLAAAAIAAGSLFPADPDQPALSQPAGPVPPLTSPAAALAWLDAQRSTLVAVAAHAADHGWPGHAIGLGATIFRYLDVGYFTDAAAMHSHARHAAAQAGDRAAEAAALTMLGAAHAAQGRLRQATGHLEQALALCRGDGNRIGEARVLGHLGMVGYCQGRYQRAAGCHRKALAIYLEIGDHAGEARELHGLGVVDLRQGRYAQAAGHLRRSLALFRDVGLRSGEAHVLGSLGELELRQDRYVQAAALLRRSLELGREIGSRLCQARALAWLGICELRRGRRRQAIGHLRQSLALHSQAGNCSGQAEALNGLGEAFLAAREVGQASGRHAAALALAIQCGDQPEQARARSGLASACQAGGGGGQARSHRKALASYADLGTPGAGQVRAQIAVAAEGQRETLAPSNPPGARERAGQLR